MSKGDILAFREKKIPSGSDRANLLIINRRNLDETPYHQWIDPDRFAISLISKEKVLKHESWVRERYKSQSQYPEYSDFHAFEDLVARYNKVNPIHEVLALSELDLLRAAKIREAYGIRGQGTASARVFRDKLLMKRAYRKASVPTPAFAPVNSERDLARFLERQKGRAVLKLRRSSASRGIYILESSECLTRLFRSGTINHIKSNCWLVERHVAGKKFHVDGILRDGRIEFSLVSEYLFAPLDFVRGTPGGSIVLDQSSAIADRVSRLAERAVLNMPLPNISLFHIDIFHCADRSRYLCGEIAARAAGNRIPEMIEQSTGINLEKYLVQSLFGPTGTARLPGRSEQCRYFGNLHVRKAAGTLKTPPEIPHDQSILAPKLHRTVGEKLEASTSAAQNLWSCLFGATSEEELRSKAQSIAKAASDACQKAIS